MNRWFRDDLKNFEAISIIDLLARYLDEGRIKVDPSRHRLLTTWHDPCHYGRKSLKAFGHAYFDQARSIVARCAPNFVELYPTREENHCCGAGGGSWATPFKEERVFFGRFKARQIEASRAGLVVTSCYNCRDQIMKSLRKEYNLRVEVKYLWELVADSLVWPANRMGRQK